MKYLAGVLALAALSAAEPEADPVYALYAPYTPYLRPYYASGYAGPLPGRSYQAVSRLHKREAEADPQYFLNAYPAPALLPHNVGTLFQAAQPIFSAPLVKSVVEAPAVVSHAVHAAPFPYAAAPFPLYASAAPIVGLGPHDCVTEGGCALRTALDTGLPAITVGSTTVAGRKRREAEAEPEAEAEAEADPYLLYNNFYGYQPYGYAAAQPYGYSAYPYSAYPYYNYNNAGYHPYLAASVAAPAAALPAPVVHAALPAPVVHAAPVAAVRVPAVHTVAKEVTYTHLGAHPIAPTTVVQSESRLVY